MAEKLTPQQHMAVTNRGGKLLVSAAAGSGKTKVLVDRLLSYILDPQDPANIDDFLIITYTKAAASELRGKIAAKLTERIAEDPANMHLQRQLQRLYLTKISTVHSFCSDILREYAYRLDISGDFRVGDENECVQLRSRAMDQVLEEAYTGAAEDPDFIAFVDTQGLGRSDSLVPEILQKVYDSARCHLDPDAWLDGCVEAAQVEDIQDAARTVWGRYLIDDLHTYLDWDIATMETCAQRVAQVTGLEKPAANLADTVWQLRRLREADTWDEVVRCKQIDYGRLVFPKKADDPSVTEPVKAVRKACREGLDKKLRAFSDPSEQILRDLTQASAAARGLVTLVRKFSTAYDSLKKSYHVLDFGDLEHKTLDLLLGKSRGGPTAAASEIAQRFREIMVDEYQDSNAVQDAIFSALSRKRDNLFMVGDVKQSIYQFRLADPGIFLEKYAAYVPAEEAKPGQGRKVLLSSNFRSSGGVLSGVNDVFYDCMSKAVGDLDYTQEEALNEGIPHIPLPEPEVELCGIPVREDTYSEEAAIVADRIAQLLDGNHLVRKGDTLRPITAEDIVILLRSPGSVGQRYVQALEGYGIRCNTGSGNDLLQAEEICTLRSLLQIISNPRQDIPLVAALTSPVFGFTADDLACLRAGRRKGYIYDALLVWEGEKADAFRTVFQKLRKAARMGSLTQLLETVFDLTNMEAVYGAMPGGEARRRNLRDFYSAAVGYEAGGPRDLEQFLSHLDSMEEKGLLTGQESGSNGAVTIMSIHKSKGLEFPVVFLCGLSRRFNRESLNEQVLCHKELGLGLSCMDGENRFRYPTISKRAIAARISRDSLSEELRVLYVAMTRARDRMIMTYASNSLEGDLRSLAHRLELCPREMITSGVPCPGHWVLLSALLRTEAGAFFNLAEKPAETRVSPHPWHIHVAKEISEAVPVAVEEEACEVSLPKGMLEALKTGLSFSYGNEAATRTPSKQTATQRKGRIKDQEAAEETQEPKQIRRSWRKPSFRASAPQGKDYGSAIHAVLQYIRYEVCTDEEAIRKEVDLLVQQRRISPEQGEMADCAKLAAFFASDLGTKLRRSSNVLREFKFSILDDASGYDATLEGEHVLLQGVVDCALMEEDGITVVDFKTDRVNEQTVDGTAAHYRPQVEAYAEALGRIYRRPVKAKALYFFNLDRFYWL